MNILNGWTYSLRCKTWSRHIPWYQAQLSAEWCLCRKSLIVRLRPHEALKLWCWADCSNKSHDSSPILCCWSASTYVAHSSAFEFCGMCSKRFCWVMKNQILNASARSEKIFWEELSVSSAFIHSHYRIINEQRVSTALNVYVSFPFSPTQGWV